MSDLVRMRPEQVKVMVVDDRPVNIKAIADLLKTEGYQILEAHGGPEALEKLATEHPDVVLLDVMMPGMDGFEVCRRIRNDPSSLFLPVVLVTALRETEYRVRGAQAGADDFLTKPVEISELLARVGSLARVKSLHDALENSNRKVRELLDQRTGQLERATQELQRLLREKAVFTASLTPTPPEPPSPASGSVGETDKRNTLATRHFKQQLMGRLAAILEGRADLSRTPALVTMLSERLVEIYQASGLALPDQARQTLFRDVIDELLGYGPIEPLLADPSVTEVMINGPKAVYAERKGKLTKTEVQFEDDQHVLRMIDRIIRPLGRRVDRNSPTVDARLPDGSRVNAVIHPCALDGPSVTIRKFGKNKLTLEDLIGLGSLTPQMADFLQACVSSRLNIVVSGGTGSGKTTLLNVLSSYIPADERIVTIEDSAELRLHQEHVVRLESKPPDLDGSGEVTIRQLVKNSLRMRPDRIVIGEVRGGEALDMLQAMNTGHDGSITTVHANTPRDTISRLETLTMMAGMDLPLLMVRRQIAAAIDLIVQQSRMKDGSRKVVSITEIQGMEGDVVILSDVFVWRDTGLVDGQVAGALEPTGIRPRFTDRLEAAGFVLPAAIYMPATQQTANGKRASR